MDDDAWIAKWLDAVSDGSVTMSQRTWASVEAHGADAVIAAAMARGVHLVRLTDDTGKLLVAASRHSFELLT